MPEKTIHWQPGASIDTLKIRARLLQGIRAFFAERGVLEVETPVLSSSGITDPQLQSFRCGYRDKDLYLHTSPEFYMKRLLAAGSGDVYQLARVFREDELGRFHNPEFSLLEWYRVGYDHIQLMDEVETLLQECFTGNEISVTRISYRQAFLNSLGIDPIEADASELRQCVIDNQIEIPRGMNEDNKDMWLDWLMLECVAKDFRQDGFTFIYDYPASMAALARLSEDDSRIAHRFELYYAELELANGFYELTDADEQRQRFEDENQHRQQMGQQPVPIDDRLIAALRSGLPECAGVALGIDRLLMLMCKAKHISEVMSFSTEL